MTLREAWDELAAGDEVMAVAAELEQMQRQLESLGATPAPRPIGHIVVPKTGAGLALPAGRARIDFSRGQVTHEDLGTVTENVVAVSDLMDAQPREPQLQNVIFHSDTLANVVIGDQEQEIYLANVPIPEANFDSVELNLAYPGEVTVLASTQRLPIGLGAVTVNGQRYGEHADAQTDSFEAVPVAPHDLWDDHGSTYADATVYTAPYDTATWTVENTGAANDLEAEVQALENATTVLGGWKTISSDTIPNGDHSVFHVSERHKFQRVRVKNTTGGQSVGAAVELMEANP